MKVCTDACLFGSMLPVSAQGEEIKRVLDIDTGTGLLALMYAQKNPDAQIDAVEIDEDAAQQAKENFEASPWKNRLNIYHTSIQQFNLSNYQPVNLSTKYDLIISNPPFFDNDLKAEDDKRNVALHSTEMSFEDLLNAVDNNLTDEGLFAVLLPYHRATAFEKLAKSKDLHLREMIKVKQTSKHDYFRSIFFLQRTPATPAVKEIIIQNRDGSYTKEFTALLKDYYLYTG